MGVHEVFVPSYGVLLTRGPFGTFGNTLPMVDLLAALVAAVIADRPLGPALWQKLTALRDRAGPHRRQDKARRA